MEKGRPFGGNLLKFQGSVMGLGRLQALAWASKNNAAGMWARWEEEEGWEACVASNRRCSDHTSIRPLWQESGALSRSVLDKERESP